MNVNQSPVMSRFIFTNEQEERLKAILWKYPSPTRDILKPIAAEFKMDYLIINQWFQEHGRINAATKDINVPQNHNALMYTDPVQLLSDIPINNIPHTHHSMSIYNANRFSTRNLPQTNQDFNYSNAWPSYRGNYNAYNMDGQPIHMNDGQFKVCDNSNFHRHIQRTAQDVNQRSNPLYIYNPPQNIIQCTIIGTQNNIYH